MRLLRSIFHWGRCPQTPGIYRFFPARMDVFLITSKGTGAARPLPFRPLSRSLGLLPSIALSRPTQVGSVSTEPLRGSTKKQRTATTPFTRCLTFGVHFRPERPAWES
jgi:hypothetical protein